MSRAKTNGNVFGEMSDSEITKERIYQKRMILQISNCLCDRSKELSIAHARIKELEAENEKYRHYYEKCMDCPIVCAKESYISMCSQIEGLQAYGKEAMELLEAAASDVTDILRGRIGERRFCEKCEHSGGDMYPENCEWLKIDMCHVTKWRYMQRYETLKAKSKENNHETD